MDNAALARQLQAEEDAAAAAAQRAAAQHHLRGGAVGQARLASLVEDAARKCLAYEDELAQAMALSVMPLEQLQAAAEEARAVSAAMGEEPPLGPEDALAQELLAWFKAGFFAWVNAPPCAACGCAATSLAATEAPTPQEAAHQAGRTEVYCCPQCGAATRFPRYNDPAKLLETRRGRCGEWSNCFTLCCRAAGLEARLVFDTADHIWSEVWSPAACRWVHLDPCEAAWDKPLLYEAGWGKRLAYVIAVGRHGAADVTRRYTRGFDTEVMQRRTLAPESWLRDCLAATTRRLRAALPPEQRAEAERRDARDAQSMADSARQPAAGEAEALPARTTGDAAWLAARGEDGSAVTKQQQQGAAVPPPGTRYRLAKDEGLAAAQPGRLCGGAVRASGENGPSERATSAFDGSPHTKWLEFGGPRGNAWLEYRLPAEQPAVVLASYALTAANDSPERDPRHTVLEAWSEETGRWVAVDEQHQLRFPQRHERQHFRCAAAPGVPASRRFRLRVVSVANPSAANSVQLACLDLYGQPPAPQQQEEQPQQEEPQQAELQQPGQQAEPQADTQQPEQRGSQPAGSAPQAADPDNPWAQLFAAASLTPGD